jgi:hypothetical protein
LIEDGTLSPNRELFHEPWTSSLPAAFNTLHHLSQNRKRNRLKLRYAYIHLTRSIGALKAAKGKAARGIAIEAYLDTKENTSEMALSRSQLSEHIRIGKRWSWLVGPTPSIICIFKISRNDHVGTFICPLYPLDTEYLEKRKLFNNRAQLKGVGSRDSVYLPRAHTYLD